MLNTRSDCFICSDRIKSFGVTLLFFSMLIDAGAGAQGITTGPATSPTTNDAKVVGLVGGQSITLDELDAYLGVRLARVRTEEYQLRAKALNELIEFKLLQKEAQSRSLSPDELIRTQARVDPTEIDVLVDRVYRAFPSRFAATPEVDAKKEIRSALVAEREKGARSKLLSELSRQTVIERRLSPFRVPVASDGAQAIGPRDAPVQIVEFSDFQCPYCGRAADVVRKVVQARQGTVRLVYRHFPLQSIHKDATAAAEASLCAGEQEKFWQMHDKLFANQQNLQLAAIRKMAEDVGLDAVRFDKCLESGKFKAAWKRDLAEGQAYGITGTPTFFVNGRLLSGAPSVESFSQVIDEELEAVTTRATGLAGERK